MNVNVNVNKVELPEDSEVEMTEEEADVAAIEAKIVHLLGIYPIISPTMLQGGLGPAVKPSLWRPILEDLIERGIVVKTTEAKVTPAERYNTYTKLMLASTHVG